MANVPAPDFQKIWSNHIASLRREYKDAIQQYPDAGGVMTRVHVLLIDIIHLLGCTPATVGESPQRTNVLNDAETSRNHELLKGKLLYGALHEVCAEALNDLRVFLEERAAKDETSTNAVKETETNEGFHEQRTRKCNSSDDQAIKSKKAAIPSR
jgi:hypothetical protein